MEKYNVTLLDSVKDKIFFKEGVPEILTLELSYKIIDEISNVNLERIKEEVNKNLSRWNYYKK